MRYAYSLHEWAVLELVALDNHERHEVLAACDALARNPNQRGTEQVIDEAGRANEVSTPRAFASPIGPIMP